VSNGGCIPRKSALRGPLQGVLCEAIWRALGDAPHEFVPAAGFEVGALPRVPRGTLVGINLPGEMLSTFSSATYGARPNSSAQSLHFGPRSQIPDLLT
jgi:hypothetical protein